MARATPKRGAPPRRKPAARPPRTAGLEIGEAKPAAEFEDVAPRAARLGVTPERVLREYARIAFADLRHIVEWTEQGFHIKGPLSKADAAPIAEIGGASAKGGPTRVKLYDKKAALDAIARYLGMFPAPHRQEPAIADPTEDALDELARLLDRLASEAGAR